MAHKPVIEWLNNLPDPHKRKALKNCCSPNSTAISMSHAIEKAFIWDDTPEGKKYWKELVEHYEKLEE